MVRLWKNAWTPKALWLSARVTALWGARRRRGRKLYTRLRLEALEDRIVPSGLTPTEVRDAYGIQDIQIQGVLTAANGVISAAPGNGAGITIAIVDFNDDATIVADLKAFDSAYSTSGTPAGPFLIPPASLNLQTFGSFSGPSSITAPPFFDQVAYTGAGPLSAATQQQADETSADVEYVHAIAPLADIVLVETPVGSQDAAAKFAASYTDSGNLRVSIVCMSTAVAENTGDDSDFTAAGVTFVAAAGDNGSQNTADQTPPLSIYPASSPNVVAVGGTQLQVNDDIDGSASFNSETGWSFPTPRTVINTSVPGSGTNPSGSSYSENSPSATWTPVSTGGFSGSYSTASTGQAVQPQATWTSTITTADLSPDSLTEISATWLKNASYATSAAYEVYNGVPGSGGVLLGTVFVNQTAAPIGTPLVTPDGTFGFQELGAYDFTKGVVTVVLDGSMSTPSSTIVADAIGIAPANASGGGYSTGETTPMYQNGVAPAVTSAVPAAAGKRFLPDVAFDAGTPVDIVEGGTQTTFTGTGLAAAAWAGLFAIADQDLSNSGKSVLSSSTALTELYKLAVLDPFDFHDITSGYNGFEAGTGYDLVTGLGSPVANLLVGDLVADLASVSGPLDYVAPQSQIPGGMMSNSITLSQPVANLEVLDNGVIVAERPLTEITLVNIFTPASLTGDTLTVNYATLLSPFATPINFNGDPFGLGTAAQILVIEGDEGGPFATETYTAFNPTGGTVLMPVYNPLLGQIVLTPSLSPADLIQFDNLESVQSTGMPEPNSLIDTSPVTNFTIKGSGVNDGINITNDVLPGGTLATDVSDSSGSNPFTMLGYPAFQEIDFANKTNVTVNDVAGEDVFILDNPTPAAGLASLTLNGGASMGDHFVLEAVPTGVNTHIVGGTGGDNTLFTTFITPAQSDLWEITGMNAGAILNLTGLSTLVKSFVNIQNLTGGPGQDIFAFAVGGSISGVIDGGGGGDFLDYVAQRSSVVVNLTTGKASLVGGGVKNIQNVIGSAVGGDSLTGAVLGSILVGNGSGNTLIGGAGRNILIGGFGKNLLEAGGTDDILIAGDTTLSLAGLNAVFAEWQSTTDSYAMRIAKLKAGAIPGGFKLVLNVTVFCPIAPAPGPRFGYGGGRGQSTLIGNAAFDWFFTNYASAIINLRSNEQVD